MRLAKGIAAAACFLVGLWLTLRAAGLLTAVLHAVPRWWPALSAAAGAAILVRSPGPGPHRRVSIALLGASGLAFAIVHHAITRIAWPFAAGAGLMAAGLALAYLTARAGSPSGLWWRSNPRGCRRPRPISHGYGCTYSAGAWNWTSRIAYRQNRAGMNRS